MKNKLIIAIFSGLIFFSFGCSIKYLPVPSPEITITEDFAVFKTNEMTIAVENRYWIKEPQNLTDYFTTFYVTIKNHSADVINISADDISLLDERENQFDPVSMNYIEKMLLPKQLEYLLISNIEDNDIFDNDSLLDEMKNDRNEFLEQWREAKRNLITYSFNFGSIKPGAQKSGFIFFPKLEAKNETCNINFLNKNIPFIRSDKKE